MRKFIYTFLLLASFIALPTLSNANHCDPDFTTDIGPMLSNFTGSFQTFPHTCVDAGCEDYFDIVMAAGNSITMSFCNNGGGANFDTGLSVWTGAGYTTNLVCNDDVCGLNAELTFVAPNAGTFRVRIGGFGGSSGNYTLAYAGTGNIVGATNASVPTMGEWGLIILALLVLSFGTVFMMRRQVAFAPQGQPVAGNVSMSGNSGIPFDKGSFAKMLAGVMVALAAVFTVATLAFGYEMTSADLPGSLIAAPIAAYLLHLVFGKK